MKILASSVEKLFTPCTLIVLNLLIIFAAEFVGGGLFFAETGLVHAIALIFVGIIIIKIRAHYAFSDHILRGFLNIQLTFFLFLGSVHVYEYLARYLFLIREDVVDLTVMASYFAWLISNFLALGFVFQVYYKVSPLILKTLWTLFIICIVGLLAPSFSPAIVAWFPLWFPKLILFGISVFCVGGIISIMKLREIMPVFRDYSRYAIPASFLLVATAFAEYFESTGALEVFNIPDNQILYIESFLFFISLSLLILGIGKLQRPQGIYSDM